MKGKKIMKKDDLRVTKTRLESMGVKIFQKDIKSIETLKRENIGHVEGWKKETIKVEMNNGTKYTYTSTPTGIYSAKRKFELV